jgi:mono/diheme cytochrome c family protein
MKAAQFAVVVAFLFGTHLALAQQGDAKEGKAVFEKRCAPCHGPDGAGKESVAKMLKVEMPHLGSKEIQAKTDEEIRKIIAEGYDKMPPPKGLVGKDVDNVIAFVRTLKQ